MSSLEETMKELRSAQIAIRVTPSEQAKLRSMAAASRMTVTDIVSLLIEGADGVLPPRVVAKMQRPMTTEARATYTTNANRGAVDSDAQRAAVAR